MPAAWWTCGFGRHSGRDHRAEGPLVAAGLLDQFDPPLAQQHLGVDDVDLLFQGVLQQAGGKGGRDQPGVLAGHFAAIVQRAAADRRGGELGQQQAQPVGHVQIAAQVGQNLGIDRREIHRVADRAGGQIIDQQVDPFDRHLGLGFFGAGPQVGRAQHVRHAEQRAGRAGLAGINVERHAAQLAALQPFDQRRFVVDAAAGTVDQPHALAHLARSAACRSGSCVSSVSGVWTVR